MEKKLRRIEIRRGTSSQRTSVMYEEGEPVYLIDKKRVYIGDNTTFGGILATNINFIENSKKVPDRSVTTDIVVDKSTVTGYILDKNDDLLQITAPINCCDEIRKDIDELNNYLDYVYDEFCNMDYAIVTDALTAINTDYDDFLRIDSNVSKNI